MRAFFLPSHIKGCIKKCLSKEFPDQKSHKFRPSGLDLYYRITLFFFNNTFCRVAPNINLIWPKFNSVEKFT
jgi:hypothetical protein